MKTLENLNEHGTDNSSNQQYDINFFDVGGELAKIYRANIFVGCFVCFKEFIYMY